MQNVPYLASEAAASHCEASPLLLKFARAFSFFPKSNTEAPMCLSTCSSYHREWICTRVYVHKTHFAQQLDIWQPREPMGKGEWSLDRHSIPVPETSRLHSANPPRTRLTETSREARQPKIQHYSATNNRHRHIQILLSR